MFDKLRFRAAGSGSFFGGCAPNPLQEERMMQAMKENKTTRLAVRVSPAEKERIIRYAKRCGLDLSEYARQRCLGYEPRAIPPDVFYALCDKLDAARTADNSAAVLEVLDALRDTLVSPGRDG